MISFKIKLLLWWEIWGPKEKGDDYIVSGYNDPKIPVKPNTDIRLVLAGVASMSQSSLSQVDQTASSQTQLRAED